ncbi:MAG: dihydrolipoyllysine-residue acetyltransferase [Gammaproteobacteria bacterium]|nr:dihydrolipoyllysine-residue acetyltransferase [Gammaproteobacteria bacterium]
MAKTIEIKVPDIGGFDQVPVIEVLVSTGDTVAKDDSLVTLESDKATMEVPSSAAGTISKLSVKVGDEVTEGDVIATIEVDDEEADGGAEDQQETDAKPPARDQADSAADDNDDGDDGDDEDTKEDEEDEDDKEDEEDDDDDEDEDDGDDGDNGEDDATKTESDQSSSHSKDKTQKPIGPSAQQSPQDSVTASALSAADNTSHTAHASPGVRKLARKLEVDLDQVTATGRKGRITEADLHEHIRARISGGSSATGVDMPSRKQIDFSKFGDIEQQPLSRIQRKSGLHLYRNWITIPHVTQHDQADITELEAFRQQHNKQAEKSGSKLSMVAFLIQSSVKALQQFPQFNASLNHDGSELILKHYYHIGVAVDTEHGLVVPVIRDADRKGLVELAEELGELSSLARDGKLKPAQMQGGCFSISSLGGIGGTAFTPIVNGPEVAILGVSRASMQPQWDESQDSFLPRLMLPLSLSYDHRVIDGADAARFTRYLAECLSDLRRLLL